MMPRTSAGTPRPTLSTRLRIWTKTLQFPPSPRGLEEAPNALAATTGGPVEPSPILATVRRSLPRPCLLRLGPECQNLRRGAPGCPQIGRAHLLTPVTPTSPL